MRCVVNENFKVFHGHSPVKLEAGQVVSGELAEMLLRSAAKKVTALNDETAPAKEQAPAHREPCVDGNVCRGPHCPPGPREQGGDSTVPPPAASPGTELDIEAPISDVLAWVDNAPERAQEALGQEQAKASPRSTLVKQLEKLAAGGA
ncbi:hypothetical protein AB0F46_21535 [Streptomyces sp. NPDC026665]|uniref:hypothetical protein n=1 Tax=Streptomyces sp. NPDC026665 TaxID=3154798 RepID=UPI0033D5767D